MMQLADPMQTSAGSDQILAQLPVPDVPVPRDFESPAGSDVVHGNTDLHCRTKCPLEKCFTSCKLGGSS